MNTLDVNFSYTVKDGDVKEFNFEFSDGNCSKSDLIEAILEEENSNLEEDVPEFEETDIELIDMQCSEPIHEEYSNEEDIFTYAQTYCECEQEVEIVNAAINCDIQGSDIDEAYNGKFDSDADFVENLLTDCGELPKLPHYIYIDWERTAKDIMYDYSDANGHYFRNL